MSVNLSQHNAPNFSYHNNCQRCPLYHTATNIGIGGNGAESPDIIIIGESPFIQENRDNIAFHPEAAAGANLRNICDNIAKQSGLKFRYTNVTRCMAFDRDDDCIKPRIPTPKEIKACMPWLREEIEITKPKVIVLAGSTSLKAFFGNGCKITEMRGNPLWRDGAVYIPMFHPSNMSERSHAARGQAAAFTPEQYTEMCIQDLVKAANIAVGTEKEPPKIQYDVVKSETQAMRVLMDLAKSPNFGLDIETNTYQSTSIDTIFKKGLRILSIALSWEDRSAVVIPLAHPNPKFAPAFQPSFEWQRMFLQALFKLPGLFYGQNLCYDFLALHITYGTPFWHDYHDLMILHHVLWSHLPHGLAHLVRVETPFGGYEDEVKMLVAALPVKERGYHNVSSDAVFRKNAYDAALTRELTLKYLEKVKADPQLWWVYNNISIPVTKSLMQMSLRGMHFNTETARQLLVENKIKMMKITKLMEELPAWQICEELMGEKIDVNKGIHRTALLYLPECGGYEPTKISKKTEMPSTDKNVMKDLVDKGSDLAFGIQRLRKLKTVEEKTLKPLPKWIGWDGRVHSFYKVTGTRTGRLASENPNFQNQDSVILYMIEAGDGRVLIVGDISQAEIRMNGIVCNEEFLLNAYKTGVGPDNEPLDIHAMFANKMFDVDYTQAKTDDAVRRVIKGLVFGQAYGMTKYGLSARTGKTEDEAQHLIDLYFSIVPRIKQVLFTETREMLLKHGFVRTIFGRYWHLSEQQKQMFKDVQEQKKTGRLRYDNIWDHPGMAEASRQAGNCLIQSSTSDMVLCGLIEFERRAVDKGWIRPEDITHADINPNPIYLENEIHDSVVVEAWEEDAMDIAAVLKECLENPHPPFEIPIPWISDISIGKTMSKDGMKKVKLDKIVVPKKPGLILIEDL